MTTLFISDLHLDASRPVVTHAFFEFLEGQASNAEALYILGDFFEVWVGDDDDEPFKRQVVEQLRRYSDSGTPLYIMHGNRDFLLGQAFCRETGAQLIDDPTVIDLYDESVLLMHGDSLCTKDADYMAFRQQARSPQWQQQLLAQDLTSRRALAAQLRNQSQSMNSLKADDIMDVTPEEVVNILEQHGLQRLIHGHTHRPACHKLSANGQAAERIVLGDWCSQGWVLRVDAQGYNLDSFAIG